MIFIALWSISYLQCFHNYSHARQWSTQQSYVPHQAQTTCIQSICTYTYMYVQFQLLGYRVTRFTCQACDTRDRIVPGIAPLGKSMMASLLTTPNMRAEGLTFKQVQSPTEVHEERDHVYPRLARSTDLCIPRVTLTKHKRSSNPPCFPPRARSSKQYTVDSIA